MMYRCESCGHLFEEGEQAVWEERHGLDAPPYEKWNGCPICKGDYEEVHQCQKCGDWHSEDELIEGICGGCLEGSINCDTAVSFLEDMLLSDKDYAVNFIFEVLLDTKFWGNISEQILELCKTSLKNFFKAETVAEMLLEEVRHLDDDGRYAFWLKSKGVK